MKRLMVSLHDVAPSTAEQSRRWLELLEARALRASLLVVPGTWHGANLHSSASFLEWLRQAEANGHEIVLHGWSHTRSTRPTGARGAVGALLGRGCEEFWSVRYAQALDLLQRGIAAMRSEGFEPSGFVAPGWLMSAETPRALRTVGLRYTTTHSRVVDVATMRSTRAIVSSQRPASRVGRFLALGTVRLVSAQATCSTPIRIAVHPADIAEPSLRRTNLRLCDIALGHGYSSMTYRDFHHLSLVNPMTEGSKG